MRIAFLCPGCRHRVEADSHAKGTRLTCPACGKAMIVPQAVIGPGVTLGGFRIEKRLGAGGMGDVFLARQLSLDRTVALKVLPGQLSRDKEMTERFLAEVKTLARLAHPHIVTAFEAGSDEGVLFLAMAYVPGKSLEERLEAEGPLKEAEALNLTRKLAQALAYAWKDHRLLHRDIKPGNVLLDAKGEPWLADFGLAKTLEMKEALTLDGSLLGTPNYMSPEQALGTQELDFRSDLYSLGAMLHHMLTGQIPFGGNSVVETLRKQVSEPLPDPRLANPKVSEGSVAVLERMLAKKREQRYERWEMLLEDLDRVLAGETPFGTRLASGESVLLRAGELSKPEGSVKDGARRKTGMLVTLAAIAALALGTGITLWIVREPASDTKAMEALKTIPETAVPPAPAANEIAAQEAGQMEKERVAAEKATQAENERLAAEKTAQAEKERIAAEKEAQEVKTREETAAAETARLERERQEKVVADARARLNDMLGEVAGLLLKSDYEKARERVNAFRDMPELAPVKTEAEALAVVLKKVLESDEPILQSFEREKGQTVKVETKNGMVEEVRILGVSAGQVQMSQSIQGALVERTFGPTDLSARERLKRLGDGESPETHIQRGLVMGHEGGNWDLAEKEFAVAGPLGEAFVGALKNQRRKQEDQAARAALVQLLKTTGLPENLDSPDRVFESLAVKPIASADAALLRKLAASLMDRYPGTEEAAMAQALTEALSGTPEITARLQLLTMLKNAGIEPDLAYPEKTAEAIETQGFGANAEKVQNAALAYSKIHGKTETARKYEAIITALTFAHADAPSEKVLPPQVAGTKENLDMAIAALKTDNPKFKGQVYVNHIGHLGRFVGWFDWREGAEKKTHPENGGISITVLEARDLKNINALAGLPIKWLWLSNCDVEDCSPLAGMPLTKLFIYSTSLKDIRPLVSLSQLRVLTLKCPIRDLRPLREMPWLGSLTVESPVLSRLDSLAGMRLTNLTLLNSPVSDLTPLTECPLQRLTIDTCDIKSLAPLAGMQISHLSILNTPDLDLKPLAGLPLCQLELQNIEVTDLPPIKSDKLKTLKLVNVQARALKPLAGCPVETLILAYVPNLTDSARIPEYFPELRELSMPEELFKPSLVSLLPNLTKLFVVPKGPGLLRYESVDLKSLKKKP